MIRLSPPCSPHPPLPQAALKCGSSRGVRGSSASSYQTALSSPLACTSPTVYTSPSAYTSLDTSAQPEPSFDTTVDEMILYEVGT